MPEYSYHIEAGLLKLQDYFSHAIQVPAYQLAIHKMLLFFGMDLLIIFVISPTAVLHPSKKLSWFHEHLPDQVQSVKEMFLKYVSH